MPTTQAQQAIINYLHTVSKGVINISQQHAQDIIDLAQQQQQIVNARAEMYQYNNAHKRYDRLRTIKLTDLQINDAILQSVRTRPAEQFIKYELFNSSNLLQGSIYTVDASLFDKI